MAPRQSEALFDIDLGAIRANYQAMRLRYRGQVLSAVVKADAYGLGLEQIARTLETVGCTTFWVNDLAEAARLRMAVPPAKVFALFGLNLHNPANFEGTGVIPVLVSVDEVRACSDYAARSGRRMAVAVQLDTGLGRLGLVRGDVEFLIGHPEILAPLEIRCWVSHLAAFDTPDDPMNVRQRQTVIDWTARLPAAPISLAASSGLYMGHDWHFDIARIGSALFGVQTSIRWQEGLVPCYRLSAPVLRVAELPAGSRVGYRGTTTLARPSRIATLVLGYSDGLPQAFAHFAQARIGERVAPFVGGMSMNLSMLDVTDLPAGAVEQGTVAVVLDANRTIDLAAQALDCAPNALLTHIGAGCRRRYVDESGTAT
jgi:alanine racemase